MLNMKRLAITGFVGLAALVLQGCQTTSGDVKTIVNKGVLSNGNKVDQVITNVCHGGTHVTMVIYDHRGKVISSTQSAGTDACTNATEFAGKVVAGVLGGVVSGAIGGGAPLAIANAGAVAIANSN